MKLNKKAGATSEIWQIFIRDSSSTTGGGLTGLLNNTASLVAYYHRDTDTTATAISLVSMTVGTFTSSGFKEIDATNMPGWYQFCPPNAAIAASAKSCAFHLKGAANMAPLPIEVQLIAADVDDGVRLGLTALPNAAAEASGGLYTRGTGAGQIKQSNNGRIDSDVQTIVNGAIAAATFAANALDAVWSTAARLLTAGTNIVLAKGTGVTGFNDLDAAGVRTAVGLASANLDTQLAAIKTDVDAIPTVTALTAAGVRTAVGLASANLDTQLSTIDADVLTRLATSGYTAPSNASIAAIKAVTDLFLFDGSNFVKAATQTLAAGAVQSIWDALTSALTTTGSIGKLIVTNLDAAITSRLASGSYTAPDNASITAIKAKTDNLPSDPADESLVIAATDAIAALIGTPASSVSADIAAVKSDTGAIKAKTDNLPAVPASQGDVTTVGTNVTAIKSKTDNLPASPAASSYKKNTAITGFQFQMFDSTTGDPATGLTVVVKISKDGGALATSSNTFAELTLGWYTIDLTSGEMNAKSVALNFAATGAKSYGILLPTEG